MKHKKYVNFLEYNVRPFMLNYFEKPLKYYYLEIIPRFQEIKSLFKPIRRKNLVNAQFSIPEQLHIGVTNLCNARCVFCAYRKLDYPKFFLDMDLYKKVIDEFKRMGGKKLMFSPTMGESLIDKTLFEKIEYAKNKDLEIRMFSNGILLKTNDNYKRIIDSGIKCITVSIGDISEKYESEIFGINENVAENKIDGLKKLIEYKEGKNSDIDIVLGFRTKREFKKLWNYMKGTDFEKFFKNRLFRIRYLIGYDNWCGTVKQEDLLGIMSFRKSINVRKRPCAQLNNMSLLANGNLRLCACRIRESENDELVIGNATKESLIKIMNGCKRKRVIDNFMKGKIPSVCINCSGYTPDYRY